MHGVTVLAAVAALGVGQTAPDFEVKDIEGQTLALEELVKDGSVILAFYPKAFTSGCTAELTAFTKTYDEVQRRGARVIAVSMDDAETLARFKAELKAPFSFVSDAEGTLARAYGVAGPGSRYASRKTFVIGEGRKILAVEEGRDAVDPAEAVAACPMRAKQDGEGS